MERGHGDGSWGAGDDERRGGSDGDHRAADHLDGDRRAADHLDGDGAGYVDDSVASPTVDPTAGAVADPLPDTAALEASPDRVVDLLVDHLLAVDHADLASVSDAHLEQLIVACDQRVRRVEVAQALLVAEFARRGGHLRDGHRSVAAWCRARLRWSSARARRVSNTGGVLRLLPQVCAAARRGAVPVDHLDDLGRVFGNDRVRDQLVEADGVFAGMLQRLFHWQWRTALGRWVQLADADGAQQDHAIAHAARRAGVWIVGEQAVLEAQGGTLDGAFLREVLDRFVEAEWAADCDEAATRLGTERVVATDLARTHRQRCFDALVAVFRAAAGAPLVTANPDPLVNIVVDDDTAARLLRMVAGEDTTPRDPLTFADYRCETIDGVPLSHEAAIAAMLVGRLRRVLVAPDGVVIDMGRTRRLFTGGARTAALLADPRCLWPGCEQPGQHCQTDHLLEWHRGGPTSPRNAGRACQHHNLFRTAHGYTARRDRLGHWHVYRPDGTDIADPHAA